MCFTKIRESCRNIQAKYESLILGKSLYGFTNLYMKAMVKIKDRKSKEED